MKSIRVLSGTGTAGVKQVKILPNVTGPSGAFLQAQQLTGFTGPTGTFQNVQNANVDAAGLKKIIISGYSSPTGVPAAVLSLPVLSATSDTTMTPGATTDTGSGTLYVVITTNSSTPTAAQIIAGRDAGGAVPAYAASVAVGSTGAKTFAATGLVASTAYYTFLAQSSAGGSSNVVGTGPVSTSAAHSAAATAFLARTSGLDATHTNAYYALIDGLVADGVWAKLDALHIYATQDATTAALNLVSTSYTAIPAGGIAFTADRGYQGVASSGTKWVNTTFDPSGGGALYQQNSAHFSAWSVTNPSAVTLPVIGLITASRESCIYTNAGDGTADFRVNQVSNLVGPANANGQGHFLANRDSSTTVQGYRNGSLIQNSTGTNSGSLAAMGGQGGFYVAGNNLVGGGVGSPHQVAADSFGSSLNSTDAGNLYSRLRTYMTVVGVP